MSLTGSLVRLIRRIYTLDTLDARFTASAARTRPYVQTRSDSSSSATDSPSGFAVASAHKRRISSATKTSALPVHAVGSGSKAALGGSPSPATSAAAWEAQPSKWDTYEYWFYWCALVVIVPWMWKTAMDASSPAHPLYRSYAPYLSRGWIFGRRVDNSDIQYAGFRNNLVPLILLLTLHPLLRRVYEFVIYVFSRTTNTTWSDKPFSPASSSHDTATSRLNRRVGYDVVSSVIYLFLLNGIDSVKIFAILAINYRIATRLPRRAVVVATWVFNVGLLFANEYFNGYPFAGIAAFVAKVFYGDRSIVMQHQKQLQDAHGGAGAVIGYGGDYLIQLGRRLDRHHGLMKHWEVLFKITILRLISFNMDYYWSRSTSTTTTYYNNIDHPTHDDDYNEKLAGSHRLTESERINIPPPPEAFNAKNYVAYILYPPLYLTGPILTFNNFMSQCAYKPSSISAFRTLLYGLRLIVTFLAMELLLHSIYVSAISRSAPKWTSFTPFQLSMLGYFSLHHIWLKLLLPWRLFRLWALIDGIDPPENMVRCVSDNYSTFAFWRGWHRSFNRWIVRYLYVPLGGGNRNSPTPPRAPMSAVKDGSITSTSTSTSTSASASPPSALSSSSSSPSLSKKPTALASVSRLRSLFNFLVVFTFVAVWHDINLRLLAWAWLITIFVLPETVATRAFPARAWVRHPTAYRMLCGVGAIGNIMLMMTANLVGFAVGVDGVKGLVVGIAGSWDGLAFVGIASLVLFAASQIMFEVREGELRLGIRTKC